MNGIPDSTTATERVLLWTMADLGDGEFMIVLPRDTVEYWLERMPVLECKSWGQLRTTVTPQVYEEVLDMAGYGEFAEYANHLAITGAMPLPGVEQEARRQYEEVPEEPPADDESFDSHDLPAVADGDWPSDPRSIMNASLPGEVLDEYADTYSTTFNGRFSTIPAENSEAAKARLVKLDYTLREDSRLLDLFSQWL